MKWGLKDKELTELQNLFSRYTDIEKVVLYGSRAIGNYKTFSDVDITLVGDDLTHSQLNKLSLDIDDLLLPYQFDISIFHTLKNDGLIDHIQRVGITIYQKNTSRVMKPPIIIEVCTDSLDSALVAQKAGAHRVELCTNLSEGGTTPSFGVLNLARKLLSIKLYVLIRPRGGDFLYNDLEFETMKSEIEYCGKIGCDGVVIGMLNSDGTVDMTRNRELVRIAKNYSMGVTFHRAFDHCVDLFQGLEDVINLGCERILTSGGEKTAMEGVQILAQLIEKADNRIAIMPGSGITPENFIQIIENTGATEIHGTFRSLHQSNMKYKNPAFTDEYDFYLTDSEKLKRICT
ncbi:MAG: nucleotidyltransferase domain-containing protein [Bacteroidales bacterium]|nr:nucleotidyltransferase domain-containing protein [Bacteroidales bacterium]